MGLRAEIAGFYRFKAGKIGLAKENHYRARLKAVRSMAGRGISASERPFGSGRRDRRTKTGAAAMEVYFICLNRKVSKILKRALVERLQRQHRLLPRVLARTLFPQKLRAVVYLPEFEEGFAPQTHRLNVEHEFQRLARFRRLVLQMRRRKPF